MVSLLSLPAFAFLVLTACLGDAETPNQDTGDIENCGGGKNPTANDHDADGLCNWNDPCVWGVGPEGSGDDDNDGVCNEDDSCPQDPTYSTDDGHCDCELPDTDGDGLLDCLDNCPELSNPDQANVDFDPYGDACDDCNSSYKEFGTWYDDGDSDGDGVCNGDDVCPEDNPDDSDGDGVCDSDDPCPADNPDDSDTDGVCDSDDICPGGDDAVDFDTDGTPDFCDTCPRSSLLEEFNWVAWNLPISGSTATGVVGDVDITYTSTASISTTSNVFGYARFPAEYLIPNIDPTIQNLQVTTNTLTFSRPVPDPLLVFSSVGRTSLPVTVQFNEDITLDFQEGINSTTNNSFEGEEGYAVVRIPGVFSTISFDYTVAENYANFVFGFGGTTVDRGNDNVIDVCDQCPLDPECN